MKSRLVRSSLVAFVITVVLGSVGAVQVRDDELRKELIAMRDRDQHARENCPTGNADAQLKCYAEVAEKIDKPNTQRLGEIVKKFGVPDARLVGADGVRAFFLVLQHSQSLDLKKRSQKGMKKAYESKVLSAMDYANFTDRLLVGLGKPQVYGSNFEFKDGKLVMSPTKDPSKLDARRRKLGLPPIAEYARVLGEMYKMETVIPR